MAERLVRSGQNTYARAMQQISASQKTQNDREQQLAERRAARADQALLEKDRLIRHQRQAIELLLMSPEQCEDLIVQARLQVDRWRRERLCSADYIERWEQLLALPVTELARAMGSDTLEWGNALRQNSPWPVVKP